MQTKWIVGGVGAVLVLIAAGYWFMQRTVPAATVSSEPASLGQTAPVDVVPPVDDYEIDPADFLDSSVIANTGTEPLSPTETAGLLLMREEEKFARDVYTALGEQWNLPIFSNIARSEETHTEAVRELLELYTIADPVAVDTPGVFKDETLQALYDDFMVKGALSAEAALVIGATVEELNIFDLDRLMAETDNEQILSVYRNLQKGSRNHLRAFHTQLQRRGISYEPQYISTNAYLEIISTPQERGRI